MTAGRTDRECDDRMGRLLEDADRTAELGIEMGRDAQRVVDGEMTNDAFHEKYHEAVIAAFSVDAEDPGDHAPDSPGRSDRPGDDPDDPPVQ